MQDMNINVQFAGFFTRFAAFCIDSFIAGLLLLVVRIPMFVDMIGGSNGLLSTKVLFEFSGWDIVIYLLTCLYFVTLTYYSGATIGKRLLKIKVISIDGEKLSFMDVLYRETIGRFLCTVTMNMGYILVGIDKEKRGFHDMLCDTRVVYDLKGTFNKSNKKKEEDFVKKTQDLPVVTSESPDNEKGENSLKNKPVSMAPSNYGYVPKGQKAPNEDSLWIEKQNETPDVDGVHDATEILEEKE